MASEWWASRFPPCGGGVLPLAGSLSEWARLPHCQHLILNIGNTKVIFRNNKMEGDAQPVCKFFQFGYCMFGHKCKHFHNTDICSIPLCSLIACTARHPKPCVYFTRNSFFKFGSGCSFLHPPPILPKCHLQDDVLKLRDDLNLS